MYVVLLFLLFLFCCFLVVRSNILKSCSKRFTAREVRALQKLPIGYKCICSHNAYHFPKLIYFTDKTIFTRYCGETFKEHPGLKVSKEDCSEQIRCISENLRRAGVFHLDILPKNICYLPNGVLSLIDFDMAYIQGESLSEAWKNPKIVYSYKTFERFLENLDWTRQLNLLLKIFECD
jgi:tRNA A-37 threonylcarbamoyl transferase component Bud32